MINISKEIFSQNFCDKRDRYFEKWKLVRYRPKRGGLATARTVHRTNKPQDSKQMLRLTGREIRLRFLQRKSKVIESNLNPDEKRTHGHIRRLTKYSFVIHGKYHGTCALEHWSTQRTFTCNHWLPWAITLLMGLLLILVIRVGCWSHQVGWMAILIIRWHFGFEKGD